MTLKEASFSKILLISKILFIYNIFFYEISFFPLGTLNIVTPWVCNDVSDFVLRFYGSVNRDSTQWGHVERGQFI